ncbi:hypothetical protein NODU109028_08365 [Nocardioides dubius]|uniref:DUF1214 domain-containing protein n=1 Tax=Nocardioides dubius TaxID=317019 RepID=A0ABP4EFJ4_9ACTN
MSGASRSALATSEQVNRDALLVELLADPALIEARDRVEQLYLGDPFCGRSAAGIASAADAAASITAAAVQHALVSDPSRPAFLWSACAAHAWPGLAVPNSGYGIDNPDNVHRRTAIDGVSSYRISVQVPPRPAAQFSFICYGQPEADGPVTREGAAIASVLLSHQVTPDAEGRFEVTVGPEPVPGSAYHLVSAPTSTWLLVRDALTDWETQEPLHLEIERIAGPEAPPAQSRAELVEIAVANTERLSRYWLAYNNELLYGPRPANRLPQPVGRPFGASVAAPFALGAGEGLLVTLDPGGCDYLGFEVTDPWGVTRPAVDALGGLNNRQALANPDGTITYWVGPADPGVHNWLDTGGLDAGLITARWQGGTLDAEAPPVRSTELVPLAEAADRFGPEHQVSAQQRADQLRRRAAAFARRLG